MTATDLSLVNYQDVLTRFQDAALSEIKHGSYQPFVYPYRALGPYLLIFYLLLPPSLSPLVHHSRYLVLGAIIYLSIDAIISCRSPLVTVGYGIGLLNALAVLWSAALIIFNDARSNFRRIEENVLPMRSCISAKHIDCVDSISPVQSADSHGAEEHGRDTINRKDGLTKSFAFRGSRTSNPTIANQHRKPAYSLESLPHNLLHRLDWVGDLVCALRGPRWDHQIPGLTPPPVEIQVSLWPSVLKPPSSLTYMTRQQLLKRSALELSVHYLILDILKSQLMRDPYFFACGPHSPFPFFPQRFPGLARTLLSLMFTYSILSAIMLLAPLVFACLLGPEWIGAHGWPWLYTPYFGSFRALSQKGIAGAWGIWWHQLFRFGFESAGDATARMLGSGWGKKEQRGQMLRTVVAFVCSAILHACGSFTSVGADTKPVARSAIFFLLQPVGVFGHKALSRSMKKRSWSRQAPWWIGELANLAIVLIWFGLTGPLIADDFAAAGVWLFEPVPISFVRGLRGEGWWKWGGSWVRWHRDETWWKSGLAF